MSDVVVRPVVSWRDQRRFIDFAWTLYRDDPHWMPPLRGHQAELLGYRRHPFFDHAEAQTFLALRGNEIVGRIAAIVNREHNRAYQEQRGFWGFFESHNDPAIAAALFDAARSWLAARGISALRGPANPSMNYECGLLVEGFDSPPTFMMTYNPDYYPRLVEGYGFRKAHDLLAYVGHREQLPEIIARLGPLAEQAERRCNVTLRPMRRRHFLEDVELFLSLYNRSFVAMWGFVPIPPREMKSLAASLKHLVVPELVLIAEVDGRGVGAVIGLPDYNPRIKRINGRLFPFGFLTLLSKRCDFKRVRVLSINVAPEFQRWGLGLVLLRGLVPPALGIGVDDAEFSWVSEDNDLARLGLEKGGARLTKRYRMYDLNLA